MVKRESELRHDMHPQKKPQKQSQTIAEKPQLEKQRGDRVEESTRGETSSRVGFQAEWEEGSHASIPPSVRWGDVK